MVLGVIAGISTAISTGFQIAAGAQQDRTNQKIVNRQFERDEAQRTYDEKSQNREYNRQVAETKLQREQAEAVANRQEAVDMQNWQNQMGIRQATYDNRLAEYQSANRQARRTERVNKSVYDLGIKQNDQVLEDAKTEKFFGDAKATEALAQTIDLANLRYDASRDDYDQTVRATNLKGKADKAAYQQSVVDANVNNRELEDKMFYEKEEAQQALNAQQTQQEYLRSDSELELAGIKNDKAQAWHDLANQVDSRNLSRDEAHAMHDYASDLATYNHDFVKDNNRLEQVYNLAQKDTALDSADNTYEQQELNSVFERGKTDLQVKNARADKNIEQRRLTEQLTQELLGKNIGDDRRQSQLNQQGIDKVASVKAANNQLALQEIEKDLSVASADTNAADLQNKLDTLISEKVFAQEDTWVKKLQQTGAAAASGRAGMSAAAATQSIAAEMGREVIRLNDSIIRGKKSTQNLQDFEQVKKKSAKKTFRKQTDAAQIKKDQARDSFQESKSLKRMEDEYAQDSFDSKAKQKERESKYLDKKMDLTKDDAALTKKKSKDTLAAQKEAKEISKTSARDTYKNTRDKLRNNTSQSEGTLRRELNKIGSQKEFLDAKANQDINTFNDNYNLKTNELEAKRLQNIETTKRKVSESQQQMETIQRNLDKSLNAAGYEIVRNDNRIKNAKETYNLAQTANVNSKLAAREDLGQSKAESQQSIDAATKNEEINKSVRKENLKSAKKQFEFDKTQNKISKLTADLRADAMRIPKKPELGPPVPTPYSYPRTQYLDPIKPIPLPKVRKGVANTSNTFSAIGNSLAKAPWGTIIGGNPKPSGS